tara:strand:+ start:1076 stop:1237 length:162 start_codon:yes stop_codon:yes gene_type:complete
MKTWIVSWSKDGIFWSQKQMKILENYDSAVWFAKTQEKRYNYVRMHQIKDGVS